MIVDPMCGCSLFNPPPKAINLKQRLSCKNFVNKQNVKNALELKCLPLLCSQRLDMLCCPQEIYLPFCSTHVSPHTSNPYKITRLSFQAGLQLSKVLIFCPKGEHLPDAYSMISKISGQFRERKVVDCSVDYQLIDFLDK